ncbi:uncharacterized protein LOC128557577 [Mercenaria mercenaria]|uniref:uncharacterized protein LOC128557577 n=1 Tax=Mercenaria mercenaria TaxID=6596 RepID=UPI00234EC279|nr:uncharacterized protein LOC128557577 [Mercenaria mercenaria]
MTDVAENFDQTRSKDGSSELTKTGELHDSSNNEEKIKMKSNDHDDDTNKKNDRETKGEKQIQQNTRGEIAEQLKKHNFYHPYTVKFVMKKSEAMNGYFEPGNGLSSPTNSKDKECKWGTIGGYVASADGKLFGLTCYHVIGDDGKVYVNHGKKLLGTYRKDIDTRFIDIAAVEVNASKECKNYLERNMTRVSKVQLSLENPNELVGRYVHKFGAVTGVTEGIIITADYTFRDKGDKDSLNYVVVIDPLASGEEPEISLNVFTPLQRPATQSSITTSPISGTMSKTVKKSSETEKYTPTQSSRTAKKTDTQSSDSTSKKTAQSSDNASLTAKQQSGTESQIDKQSSRTPSQTFSQCLGTASKTDGLSPACHSDNLQKDCHKKRPSTLTINNPTVYVRDIYGDVDSFERNRCSGLFSKEGDSGAIICTLDPSNGLTCLAVSVLSGGGLEICGDQSKKTVSLMLGQGLQHISTNCSIEFI